MAFGRFWEGFGVHFGRISDAKIDTKFHRFLYGFSDGFWEGFGRHFGQISPPKVNKNQWFSKQWERVKNSTSCRRELDLGGSGPLQDLRKGTKKATKKSIKISSIS